MKFQKLLRHWTWQKMRRADWSILPNIARNFQNMRATLGVGGSEIKSAKMWQKWEN